VGTRAPRPPFHLWRSEGRAAGNSCPGGQPWCLGDVCARVAGRRRGRGL